MSGKRIAEVRHSPDSHQAAADGDPGGCGAAEGEGGECEQQLHGGGGVRAAGGPAWLYSGGRGRVEEYRP